MTPLGHTTGSVRQNSGMLFDDLMQSKAELTGPRGLGWDWVNLAFLAGGIAAETTHFYLACAGWHAGRSHDLCGIGLR